jgi:hypothetical protein
MSVHRHRLQAKGVFARGNHGQGHWMSISAGVHVFALEPRAQARIENFRLALPEIGRQPALDAEVI